MTSAINIDYSTRQTTPEEQKEYLRNILGDSGCAGIFRIARNEEGVHYSQGQTMLRVEELDTYDFYNPQECIALNSFKSLRTRSSKNLGTINALYLDLDIYKADGLSLDAALKELSENEFGKTMPVPSYVIRSGRGAYLIWLLEACEATQENRAHWYALTDRLLDLTQRFACDRQCRDIVRVLRVPGSINAKPGVVSEVVIDTDNKHLRYTMDFISDFLGVTHDEVLAQVQEDNEKGTVGNKKKCGRTNRKKQTISKKKGGRKRKRRIYRRDVLDDRISDIELVLLIQGVKVVGHREVGLFYYRHFYQIKGYSATEALRKTLELNAKLAVPLSEKEVRKATASRKSALYYPKNETLARALNITPEIERQLKTIILAAERAQRRRLKNGRAMSRAEETALKRARRAELRAEGKTIDEVCRIMGISRTTYYNLKKGRKKSADADKEKPIAAVTDLKKETIAPSGPMMIIFLEIAKQAIACILASAETENGGFICQGLIVHLLSDNYMHKLAESLYSSKKRIEYSRLSYMLTKSKEGWGWGRGPPARSPPPMPLPGSGSSHCSRDANQEDARVVFRLV